MTTHPVFNRWLWGTMLATAFLIWIGLQCSGCGGDGKKPPDVPKLMSCAERVLAIVTQTPNCADIGRKVDELLAAQAECFEALSGERAVQWSCGDGGR